MWVLVFRWFYVCRFPGWFGRSPWGVWPRGWVRGVEVVPGGGRSGWDGHDGGGTREVWCGEGSLFFCGLGALDIWYFIRVWSRGVRGTEPYNGNGCFPYFVSVSVFVCCGDDFYGVVARWCAGLVVLLGCFTGDRRVSFVFL